VHGSTGHTWHHSDQNLTEIILDGSGEMGAMMRDMMGIPPETPRMPAWRGKLTDDDIAAILAYIKAGWTPEQRRFQAETPMMR
jgi:mono/diheme cytochrome c family protein